MATEEWTNGVWNETVSWTKQEWSDSSGIINSKTWTTCPTTNALRLMTATPFAPIGLASDENIDWLRKVQLDLEQSETGRHYLQLYYDSKEEANELIQKHADLRDQISGLAGVNWVLNIIDVLRNGAALNGTTTANALVGISAKLIAYGSPNLRKVLTEVRAALPNYYGLTYDEILSSLAKDTSLGQVADQRSER
jgi:hypothetical protein